ncbi:eCIS core domain-containing protein [Paractinoplanes rishiriensis]|uniref:Uncharacterized protein n=1 Tax=Paractinoplanes rishiriensis TaxID=1050105 RepID=A0A919KAH6_9ACTN|nr:DUF4157 domain-containing protein [Actinoplanes rishiriensis]GIE99656.1 hypothetical protein Ari01nite_71210 [Actinoplanes rishiriensis]
MTSHEHDPSAPQREPETPQRRPSSPPASAAALGQAGNAAVARLLAGAGRVDRDTPAAAGGGPLDSGVAQRIEAGRVGGAPLPAAVREPLQQQLGAELDSARVHTDAAADGLARSVQATAFTTGSDIFFSSGSYQPGTSAGRELIAHEAVHVVQQGGGVARAAATTVSDPADPAEAEAYRLAPQLARGIDDPGPAVSPAPVEDPAGLMRAEPGASDRGGERLTGRVFLALQRSAGNRAATSLATARVAGSPAATAPTMTAAPAVQRQAGLPGHRWLRLGDTGPDVDELHRLLNAAGAAPPLAGSTFDAATRQALVAFQGARGLGADGIAGPLTWGALDQLAGTATTPAPGPDQHAGAARPDAAERTAIRAELNPSSAGPGGTVRPWDGRGTTAAALANRTALRTEVTAALEAMLLAEMPAINAAAAAPRKLAMTDLEGAGKQAKRVADDMFGSLASGAVLTTGQRGARAAFAFTGGVNLLDASDLGVRTPDAADLASWMAETDSTAAQKQQDHGFDKARSVEERQFLNTQILAPFVAAHRADLEKFDRFGFAFAEEGPRVLIQPSVIGSATHSDTAPAAGVPSRAERLARWSNWETLVHEYFHTLAHPAFVQAEQGRRVMSEGFCEMFTKEVLSVKVPVAQADGDTTLRGGVEGTDAGGGLFPGFTADLVPDYSPGSYAEYLAHAEGVRAALGGRGADAVRAAYFQGHVELIGLTPAGGQAPAADRSRDDLVTVPAWVQSVFALSVMTAAPEADILAANPGLAAAGPLPRQVHVPGCRQHTVVAATERSATGGVADRQVESRAEIAAQNGVTEPDLNRANPNRDWSALRAGDQILIPRH